MSRLEVSVRVLTELSRGCRKMMLIRAGIDVGDRGKPVIVDIDVNAIREVEVLDSSRLMKGKRDVEFGTRIPVDDIDGSAHRVDQLVDDREANAGTDCFPSQL